MSVIVTAPPKKPKVSAYKYAWARDDNGLFGLIIDTRAVLYIWQDGREWRMTAQFGDKKYNGTRSSLEGAAKAADRLLYKNLPKEWTITDARAIIRPWEGDLNL